MVEIPLDEQIVAQLCGRPVCVVTQDGRRYIGQLSRCHQGKLILNEQADSDSSGHAEHKEPRQSKKGKKSKSKTSKKKEAAAPATAMSQYGPYGGGGYPPPYPYQPQPYPFYGPRIELDFALIALLFLLLI